MRIASSLTPGLSPKRHSNPSNACGRGGISLSCSTVVPTAEAYISAMAFRARLKLVSSSGDRLALGGCCGRQAQQEGRISTATENREESGL
eukprot:3545199-Prymnesium_polylepis.2